MPKESDQQGEPGADRSAEAEARIEKARSEQLTSLVLSGMGLNELPESIGRLTWLVSLDLSNNNLATLPESVGRLELLRTLIVDDNQLKCLPESVSRLTRLRALSLDSNSLEELPECVCRLPHLDYLALFANSLSTLPESVGQLAGLSELAVQRNRLVCLPDSVGNLTNLRALYLGYNQLAALPESVGRLLSLERLDLQNNQLTTLPESLRNLQRLKRLLLHDNDALGIPAEALGPAWREVYDGVAAPAKPDAILRYYFRSRGAGRPLNEAKLIMVGWGGVGKTSIVNRLVHGSFQEGEKETRGIQITEWVLRLRESEDVRLNVWDFGGQEIMHAAHQFFLTRRSLYLLVLNGREGRAGPDADYWLKLIESFGDHSPVVVVLNKIKEHPFDVIRRELQQKYPFVRDFIKTDCADGTGFEELRRAIERETDRLEHLRDAFPASWFGIKDKLARMEKNYVSFEDYRAFCVQHGERDAAAQDALAGYLHDLGIVLNYREDPRLQDTYVLNPHWVTSGIYKILNSPKLERQQGEIRLRELPQVLDPKDYPAEMRRFVIDLMKKFELCFSFPDDDAHYLIPALLDQQEPRETAEFRPAECLNFQYHYPVLPEGLLPRFIVRTHALSEGQARWRTGVVLEFEGCRALVKADVQDKKVFINVVGPAADRRRLLAVIRSDFERIHRDIRNLNPQEMVPLPGTPEASVPYEKLLAMERGGHATFVEYVAGRVVELNVRELLNGVDLEGTRRRERLTDERKRGVRLFYSYSHKDEGLRNELETHLKLLQRLGLIDAWHDRKIEAGDDWGQRIDDNLERADIILLLVSADFIASDYSYQKEMERALERQKNGEAEVVPVIVRDVDLEDAPFAGLQYLPKGGLPVMLWEHRDTAWRSVAEGIKQVAERVRKSLGPPG
jgi:internalin A